MLFMLLVQFVADGVFYAELNELLIRELAEDGYSGVEVRVTPLRTEIIIRATRTQGVLGTCCGGWRACASAPVVAPGACVSGRFVLRLVSFKSLVSKEMLSVEWSSCASLLSFWQLSFHVHLRIHT